MEKVQILDTTLRDGVKLPHLVLDAADRLLLARQLAALGADVLDVGYPAASPEEREWTAMALKELAGPMLALLSRALPEDVEAACELLKGVDRGYLHLFLHLSPTFLKEVLHLEGGRCLKLVEQSVRAGVGAGMTVQFSCGEAAEAERAFLLETVQAASAAGAGVVSLADTNGALHPREVADLVREVGGCLAAAGLQARLGIHCHNDLGLATANTLAGLEAGARHAELTVGGIGPRAGNAALEEVVFALEAFRERLGLTHGVHLERLARTAGLLGRLTGLSPAPMKPIIGRFAFRDFRGSNARQSVRPPLDSLLQDRTIGRSQDVLFGGQEMTSAGFRSQLEHLGVDCSGANLEKVYRLFLSQARRGRGVHLAEVTAMIEDVRLEQEAPYALSGFNVMTGSQTVPVGSVELRRGEETVVQSAHGSGPVDALCRAVDRAVGITPDLLLYSADSVGEGKDARAEVTVSLSYLGRRFHGHAGSADVVEASLRAYLDAVNGIETFRRGTAAEPFYVDGESLWWE